MYPKGSRPSLIVGLLKRNSTAAASAAARNAPGPVLQTRSTAPCRSMSMKTLTRSFDTSPPCFRGVGRHCAPDNASRQPVRDARRVVGAEVAWGRVLGRVLTWLRHGDRRYPIRAGRVCSIDHRASRLASLRCHQQQERSNPTHNQATEDEQSGPHKDRSTRIDPFFRAEVPVPAECDPGSCYVGLPETAAPAIWLYHAHVALWHAPAGCGGARSASTTFRPSGLV
jgi:hypothetical protein